MIVTENVTRYGREFVRTYSDGGYRIMQDGTGRIYDEAVDPINSGRTYTETEEEIEIMIPDEITEKAMAYDILVGEDE